jgi:hypothetical protein
VLGNGERLQRVHRWDLRRRETNAADAVSQRLLEWLSVNAESECASIARQAAQGVPPAPHAAVGTQSLMLRPDAVREAAERLLAEWLSTPGG